MAWPPTIGEVLPRGADAFGVEEKLSAYCLNPDHELGAAKARGFQRILGIAAADVEYLAAELLVARGMRRSRVSVITHRSACSARCG